MTGPAPTRDQCAQDLIQALADYYGDAWEQVKAGFGQQDQARPGAA